MKSSDHKQKAILIISFLLIWAFCLIVFCFFTDPTDALSYSIMILGILLPVAIFVYSLIIGLNDYWGKRKRTDIRRFQETHGEKSQPE